MAELVLGGAALVTLIALIVIGRIRKELQSTPCRAVETSGHCHCHHH